MVYQFTTPNIIFHMPEAIHAEDITTGILTFSQKNRTVLEKENIEWVVDPVGNLITVGLSQEETGAFSVGTLKMQIHFLIGNQAFATKEMEITVAKNLHQEVLANG